MVAYVLYIWENRYSYLEEIDDRALMVNNTRLFLQQNLASASSISFAIVSGGPTFRCIRLLLVLLNYHCKMDKAGNYGEVICNFGIELVGR